jgi:hypothetical protein
MAAHVPDQPSSGLVQALADKIGDDAARAKSMFWESGARDSQRPQILSDVINLALNKLAPCEDNIAGQARHRDPAEAYFFGRTVPSSNAM